MCDGGWQEIRLEMEGGLFVISREYIHYFG